MNLLFLKGVYLRIYNFIGPALNILWNFFDTTIGDVLGIENLPISDLSVMELILGSPLIWLSYTVVKWAVGIITG